MKRVYYIMLLFLSLLLSCSDMLAQKKTIVITRKIEKQFALKKNPRLILNTERGIIFVKAWERNEIKIVLKLVAKNTEREMAEEELNLMKYALTETRNTVFVSNHMLLTKAYPQISSVIRAEYEIFVPHDIEIEIDNRYGKVDVQGIKGSLYGALYYSDLSMLEADCAMGISVNIGDLVCKQTNLTGNITTRHANVSLSEISGKLIMNMEYGKLHHEYGRQRLLLNIRSNATDIFIRHSLCYPLELIVEGAYCPLDMKRGCYITDKQFLDTNYTPDKDQSKWKLRYLPPDKAPKLVIYARFGTLNLF